ncbi:MAG: FxsA family protein [Deltaproteobacteria bacterium]|nr:FxsA family protein [Deltaproteobacteria bacterium]
MRYIYLLVILLIIAESLTYLLISSGLEYALGARTAGWVMLAEFLISTWAGYRILRQQGLSSLTAIRQESDPFAFLSQSLSGMIAGVLLILPGLLTDLLGLILRSHLSQKIFSSGFSNMGQAATIRIFHMSGSGHDKSSSTHKRAKQQEEIIIDAEARVSEPSHNP